MPIFVDPSVVAPPPPDVITSPDGILTATVSAARSGVLLRADYSDADPVPESVRFYRNGVPISSGHDAPSPGGVATAFDLYVPAGDVLTYSVAPIVGGVEGPRSAAVAVVVQTVPGPREVYVQSWTRPDLSLRVLAVGDLPEFTEEDRLNLGAVPGSRFPAGSRDLHLAATTAFEFLTETPQERRQMGELLRSGPLYFSFRADVDIDDFWALAGSLTHALLEPTSRENARLWQVELTQVDAPPTEDSPLVIPGRTYADLLQQVGSYAEFDAVYASYEDYLGA